MPCNDGFGGVLLRACLVKSDSCCNRPKTIAFTNHNDEDFLYFNPGFGLADTIRIRSRRICRQIVGREDLDQEMTLNAFFLVDAWYKDVPRLAAQPK